MTPTLPQEFSTEYFARYQFLKVPDFMIVLRKNQFETRFPVGKNGQLEQVSGPVSGVAA